MLRQLRGICLGYVTYVAYGLARSAYKVASSPEVKTERARLPLWCMSDMPERREGREGGAEEDDNRHTRKSSQERREEEIRRKSETRPLLLSERVICVATSPLTTMMNIPSDVRALEVLVKRHDPSVYDLHRHPFHNSAYESVLDFILA